MKSSELMEERRKEYQLNNEAKAEARRLKKELKNEAKLEEKRKKKLDIEKKRDETQASMEKRRQETHKKES
jgi:hypothetical protein